MSSGAPCMYFCNKDVLKKCQTKKGAFFSTIPIETDSKIQMGRESRLGEAKCEIMKNAAKQRVKQLKQEKNQNLFLFRRRGGGGDKDTKRDRDRQTETSNRTLQNKV